MGASRPTGLCQCVRGPEELLRTRMARLPVTERIYGVLPDVTNLIRRDQIIALAARHRLPAVYPYRYYAASGGLLSYGSEQADVFRRAASYVRVPGGGPALRNS